MPTPIQSFWIKGFKDWRPDLEESQMDPQSLHTATNIWYQPGGAVKKRPGFTKITNNVAGQDEAEFFFAPRVYTTSGLLPNYNQHAWVFNVDTGRLFRNTLGELMEQHQLSTGSDLQDGNQTMGPASPTAINYFRVWPISVITFGDDIYATSLRYGGYSGTDASPTYETESGLVTGASKPIKYDAQAGTFSRPTVHALAGGTSGFPRARCAITKYDRVFVANVHSEGVYRYPSRVYWSNAGTSETFESNSYIDVGADDGSEVTAMIPFGEQIIIFKNQSVWALTGTDEDTFALYQLDDRIGTESTYGCTAYQNMVYFYDYKTGVWTYDGARFVKISDPIDHIILNDVNREAVLKAFLFMHEDRVYVSLPWNETSTTPSDTNTRTFVYDNKLRAWSMWTVGFQPAGAVYTTDFGHTGVGVKGTNQFITAFDNALGLFIMDESSLNDGGDIFDVDFETCWMNPGDIGDRHRIRRLEMLFSETTDNVIITAYRDFDRTNAWKTFTYNAGVLGAGLDEVFVQDQTSDGQWFQFVKFRFQTDSSTDFLQLNGVGMTISNRPILRGQVHHVGYTP